MTPLTQIRPLDSTTQLVATHRPLRSRDWSGLEPSSFYARCVRSPLLYLLTLVISAPGLLLIVPIALVNAVVLGGFSHVFFRQDRIGRRGRAFTLLKFRTMAGMRGEGTDIERVTRFGRFLRNTHMDELPQLWNVLRGDMSLIGPRPEMISIERWATRQLPAFGNRLVLRPGITGRAQITQGYTPEGDLEAYREKARINADYLRSLSLGADLRILCSTAFWMVRGRGWRKPAN